MSAALSANASVVEQLRRQLIYTQPQQPSREIVTTGFPSLDRLLPSGGLPTGSLMEWIEDEPGVRTASLALKCVSGLMKDPGAMVVLDAQEDFCPASVESLGIPLSRLLVVRPGAGRMVTSKGPSSASGLQADTLWALEQIARCAGVRIVMAWIERLSSTAQRRLQLAVENSGTTVILIRPVQALAVASWADLQFHVQSVPVVRGPMSGLVDVQAARVSEAASVRSRLIVRLVRSRNMVQHQGCAFLEVHHETGVVSETAELAGAAAAT